VAPLYTVDPVDGIRKRAGEKVTVSFSDGTDTAQAISLARAADIAIVMVGDAASEGRDHSISLSGSQDDLVKAVAAANPRTVVVLKTGSAILMPWVDQVPAILEAWYPGEEDGNAVAEVLWGDFNPSAKLPITFPRRLEDVPSNTPEQYPGTGPVVEFKNNYNDEKDKTPPGSGGVAHYSEGVFVGYRHYDTKGITPLFPFGHGLSYTSFTYKDLKISPGEVSLRKERAPTVTVDVTVVNSGGVRGAEVVQVYVGLPSTDGVPQPLKQLKGFQKISLESGKQGRAHIVLDARSLSYWDVKNHSWVIAPGDYQIMVGASS